MSWLLGVTNCEFFAWWLRKHASSRRWTIVQLALAIGWSIYPLLLLGGAALLAYTIVQFLPGALDAS